LPSYLVLLDEAETICRGAGVSLLKEGVSKWVGIVGGIVGIIGGIVALIISIGGVVYGYGSQGGQIGQLEDRVHSLEAKLDVLASDIGDLKRQVSMLDSRTAGTGLTLADNSKNLEARLTSVASNIADLEKEVSQLDSRTSQNTSALADAHKKFIAVNPAVQRCLDLADELESGHRSNLMGWSAVDRTTVLDTMRELNCTSMPH
jgi:prefoldin subunit 5